jgi:hypothetical protein
MTRRARFIRFNLLLLAFMLVAAGVIGLILVAIICTLTDML